MYASTFQANRALLWHEIRHKGSRGFSLVILMRLLLSMTTLSFDVWRDQSGMHAFQYIVSDSDLMDLDYSGPKFTWWNNRDVDPIGKKLDHVLVNGS